ncbi:MAG: branched-chain amino acid ABC transporter permease [Myxococcota bacterium]
MSTLVQLLFSGLALGAVYALIALGFVVIYRASQVFNFAQGEFLSFGAFMMVALAGIEGMPWAVALVLAMAATGAMGAVVERVVLRPLVGRPVFVTIILTIFVGYLLRALVVVVWGSSPRGMPTPWDTSSSLNILGGEVLLNSIGAVVAGALALGVFFVLIKYSKLGVGMRATSNDQEVALALGIPVGRIFGSTWFLSGVYAALGGIFLAMFPRSVDPNLGLIALRAFPAVIVGGLDSPLGTVLAGLMLGLLEVLAQGYLNEQLGQFGHGFHTVFPYVVMILFLVVRPYGFFGTKEVERV